MPTVGPLASSKNGGELGAKAKGTNASVEFSHAHDGALTGLCRLIEEYLINQPSERWCDITYLQPNSQLSVRLGALPPFISKRPNVRFLVRKNCLNGRTEARTDPFRSGKPNGHCPLGAPNKDILMKVVFTKRG